jgi:hypothetical protein
MSVTARFTSAGVNRLTDALDWGEQQLLAYASHHAVIVYDPQVRLRHFRATRVRHRRHNVLRCRQRTYSGDF